MRTRIAVGAGLLLTLGSALAGTLIYGQSTSTDVTPPTVTAPEVQQVVTPELIALWKATAVSSDYVAPRVPI